MRTDYPAALKTYQQALDIDLANFGPEHRWVAEDYFNLAECYNLLGSDDKAIRYAQKSVDMLQANCRGQLGRISQNAAKNRRPSGQLFREFPDW